MAYCFSISDRAFECGRAEGVFDEIIEMKIIDVDDLVSWSTSNRTQAIWDTAGNASIIQGANNSILLNIATKGGETYSLAYDPTITVVMPNDFITSSNNTGTVGGSTGWVIALKFANGKHLVVGLGAPLSVLSIEGASNANHNVTVTFGVEDWQTGTTIYEMTESAYNG